MLLAESLLRAFPHLQAEMPVGEGMLFSPKVCITTYFTVCGLGNRTPNRMRSTSLQSDLLLYAGQFFINLNENSHFHIVMLFTIIQYFTFLATVEAKN